LIIFIAAITLPLRHADADATPLRRCHFADAIITLIRFRCHYIAFSLLILRRFRLRRLPPLRRRFRRFSFSPIRCHYCFRFYCFRQSYASY